MTPTTLSCERKDLLQTLQAYEKVAEQDRQGAEFIGMHLEGPYFSINQRGAQDPRYIRSPDPEEYQPLLSRYKCIKRWSAAPELKGALDFAACLRSHHMITGAIERRNRSPEYQKRTVSGRHPAIINWFPITKTIG